MTGVMWDGYCMYCHSCCGLSCEQAVEARNRCMDPTQAELIRRSENEYLLKQILQQCQENKNQLDDLEKGFDRLLDILTTFYSEKSLSPARKQ